MSYAIIGFGKIGHALAKAFARKGIEVSVATTRDPKSFALEAAAIGPKIIAKKLADAVKAAREMLSSFTALASSWKERYQVEAGLGIGINEGDVVAGNIGSSSYMNYTIIGDTVNIAALLCQRARAGEMLFSNSLKQSLDAHGLDIGATALPPLQLRGLSNPIDIFCVPLQSRVQLGPLAA